MSRRSAFSEKNVEHFTYGPTWTFRLPSCVPSRDRSTSSKFALEVRRSIFCERPVQIHVHDTVQDVYLFKMYKSLSAEHFWLEQFMHIKCGTERVAVGGLCLLWIRRSRVYVSSIHV